MDVFVDDPRVGAGLSLFALDLGISLSVIVISLSFLSLSLFVYAIRLSPFAKRFEPDDKQLATSNWQLLLNLEVITSLRCIHPPSLLLGPSSPATQEGPVAGHAPDRFRRDQTCTEAGLPHSM